MNTKDFRDSVTCEIWDKAEEGWLSYLRACPNLEELSGVQYELAHMSFLRGYASGFSHGIEAYPVMRKGFSQITKDS